MITDPGIVAGIERVAYPSINGARESGENRYIYHDSDKNGIFEPSEHDYTVQNGTKGIHKGLGL